MSDFNEQLARMKGLMNYGKINENAKEYKNYTLEYHAKAADGKTYGIIRECNKYYIKQAVEGKELMAESYKYLGGFNNKKDYEYYSYANALKQFELKMGSINEACDGKVNIETLNPFRSNEVLVEGTEKMKNDLARVRQIMYNTSMLMNESNTIGATPITSQPESEHANSADEDAPFTSSVTPDMDFSGKKSSCPKCEGEPFDKGEKCGCKAEKGKDVSVDGSVASMKPKGGKAVKAVNESSMDGTDFFAGDCGVGTGDAMKFNSWVEGSKQINEEDEEEEVSPEDVETPEDEKEGYVDSDVDNAQEGDEFEYDETEDEPEVDGEEEGEEFDDEEGDDFDDEEIDIDDEDMGEEVDESDPESIRAEIERLESLLSDLEGEEGEEDMDFDAMSDEEGEEDTDFDAMSDDEDFGDEGFDGGEQDDFEDSEDEFGEEELNEENEGLDDLSPIDSSDDFSLYDEPYEDEYTEEEPKAQVSPESMQESKRRYMNKIVESVVKDLKKGLNEDTLHDFGKHPGYRKKPMSLPSTGEDKNQWGEDWNDDSVYSEEPFGSKIGSSAPFEDVVDKITAKVMEGLKKK